MTEAVLTHAATQIDNQNNKKPGSGIPTSGYKSYVMRSHLAPELKDGLVQKTTRVLKNRSKYDKTVPEHVIELIRNAGTAGIDLKDMSETVFSNRKPVSNPREYIQHIVASLRKQGQPIYNTGSRYRLGAPIILRLEPQMQGKTSNEQSLSDRELEVLRILRDYKDVWLSSNEIAGAMKKTRGDQPVLAQHIAEYMKNMSSKGITIDYKGANAGVAGYAYKLVQKPK